MKKNEKKNFYRQNKKEKDKAKENPENHGRRICFVFERRTTEKN